MNLWILTEERPKKEVISQIIGKFAIDKKITCFIDTIRILPIIKKNGDFEFTYEVIGFNSTAVNKIFSWTVSTPHLVALVNHAINEEREACAALCFHMWDKWMNSEDKSEFTRPDAEDCAAQIRARGRV